MQPTLLVGTIPIQKWSHDAIIVGPDTSVQLHSLKTVELSRIPYRKFALCGTEYSLRLIAQSLGLHPYLSYHTYCARRESGGHSKSCKLSHLLI